jgi:hypothetical protein
MGVSDMQKEFVLIVFQPISWKEVFVKLRDALNIMETIAASAQTFIT